MSGHNVCKTSLMVLTDRMDALFWIGGLDSSSTIWKAKLDGSGAVPILTGQSSIGME